MLNTKMVLTDKNCASTNLPKKYNNIKYTKANTHNKKKCSANRLQKRDCQMIFMFCFLNANRELNERFLITQKFTPQFVHSHHEKISL